MTAQGISVVIPAYNAEAYLGEALESVLAQEPTPSEVIVVDDGSTDLTANVAQGFGRRVLLLKQENRGIGAARNAGAAATSGRLLAFLDADDLWPAGRLAALVGALADGVDGVFGRVVEFAEGAADGEPTTAALAGSMLIRRDSFDRVGPFREDVRVGEFVDWFARAQDQGIRFTNVETVVLRRRLHASNTGLLQRDARSDYVKVLRAALHRRREADLK